MILSCFNWIALMRLFEAGNIVISQSLELGNEEKFSAAVSLIQLLCDAQFA